MIPFEVERAAHGDPIVQVALDGWWKRANIARLPTTDRPLPGSAAGDVAVEVLWPGPPVIFVGARDDDRPPLDEIAARATGHARARWPS